jgi:hypothetical protein
MAEDKSQAGSGRRPLNENYTPKTEQKNYTPPAKEQGNYIPPTDSSPNTPPPNPKRK